MIPDTLYGEWNYRNHNERFPYDDTPTYQIAGEWVSGRGLVEDWGCGTAWMEKFIDGPYRGLDGAWSHWADRVVDLRNYRSDDAPCAVMRHVLEHNADWRQIAANFAHSWTDRAALVLFIPPQPEDVYTSEPDWPVPDIGVSGPDLFALLAPLTPPAVKFRTQQIWYPPENSIQWGWEGVILMERHG